MFEEDLQNCSPKQFEKNIYELAKMEIPVFWGAELQR